MNWGVIASLEARLFNKNVHRSSHIGSDPGSFCSRCNLGQQRTKKFAPDSCQNGEHGAKLISDNEPTPSWQNPSCFSQQLSPFQARHKFRQPSRWLPWPTC